MSALPAALAAAVKGGGPGWAVFDADGTLWREDVGEAFLRHLVHLGWVALPDGRDPYQAYEEAVARDRAGGYAYAAQLTAGLLAAQVQAEAQRFAAHWIHPRLITETQALLALCRDAGLGCAVVSASQIDIVRAAVPHAGISWERCAGMSTRVDEAGRYTDALVEPLTYAEGKVAMAASRGWHPLQVAGGDSHTGDLALLAAARVAVVVASSAETPLALEAARRGWIVLAY